MSKINGYPIVYMPDRDDVIGTSGCVYEHILVAESILGRRLLPGETVHHKDRNRANNSPENIMVFKTNADHVRFHKTGIAVLDGDVYVSPEIKRLCPMCGAEISKGAKLCKHCRNKEIAYRILNNDNYTSLEDIIVKNKDKIYEMAVSGMNVTEISKYFGMSWQTFGRICRRLGITYKIPKPPKEKKEPYIPKKVKRININTQEATVFNSISEAAKAIEKPDTHIRSVCNGKRKSAYGCYWEYVD